MCGLKLMFRLPSFEVLSQRTYTFDDAQRHIEDVVVNRLTPIITELAPFRGASEEELINVRCIALNVVRFYVNAYVRDNGQMFIIQTLAPSPFADNRSIVMTLISQTERAFVEILCNHILSNLNTFGVFVEYWGPISPGLVLFNQGAHDMVIYSSADAMNDAYENFLDRSFEASRIETLQRRFSELHDWKITFTGEETPRTEENEECGLCCERSAFECANCHYVLCPRCVMHVKHSTAECPACRHKPIRLNRVQGGDWSNETDEGDDITEHENREAETNDDETEDIDFNRPLNVDGGDVHETNDDEQRSDDETNDELGRLIAETNDDER